MEACSRAATARGSFTKLPPRAKHLSYMTRSRTRFTRFSPQTMERCTPERLVLLSRRPVGRLADSSSLRRRPVQRLLAAAVPLNHLETPKVLLKRNLARFHRHARRVKELSPVLPVCNVRSPARMQSTASPLMDRFARFFRIACWSLPSPSRIKNYSSEPASRVSCLTWTTRLESAVRLPNSTTASSPVCCVAPTDRY